MTPMRTILHPTDFSEHSAGAFALACRLAHDHGAKLFVLHVGTPPMVATGGVMTAPPPSSAEYDRPALEAKLRELRPLDAKMNVERQLVYGMPTVRILDAAVALACDLIVMGTHGRTGMRRVLVGSVAEYVMRKTPCPVLTLSAALPPGGPGMAVRRILYATDLGESSAPAFATACSLARDYGAGLVIIHVVNPLPVTYGEIIAQAAAETDRQSASRRLAQLRPADPNVTFEHCLAEGEPARCILEAVRTHECDLIIMGSHGRTGVSRLIMGSVAERVVREAPCPVLTMTRPMAERETSAPKEEPRAAATT